MKTYRGEVENQGMGGQEIIVTSTSTRPTPLDLAASQAVYNHSPDGFNWGYSGSGPAQTALAILLDVTGDPELAMRLHQAFKFQVVAGWGEQWEIGEEQVRAWIETMEGKED